MKDPRWCSKHSPENPFKVSVQYEHNGKTHTHAFEIFPVLNPSGHKNAKSNLHSSSSSSKGGVDRCNKKCGIN